MDDMSTYFFLLQIIMVYNCRSAAAVAAISVPKNFPINNLGSMYNSTILFLNKGNNASNSS